MRYIPFDLWNPLDAEELIDAAKAELRSWLTDAKAATQKAIEDYEKNLRQLVERMKKTGAKLIWASTTPVPEGKLAPPRTPGDAVRFNAVAKKVMDENGVAVNDLYAFAAPRLKEIQRPANVHFTNPGSEALAKQVASAIEAALKK